MNQKNGRVNQAQGLDFELRVKEKDLLMLPLLPVGVP